MAPEDKPPKRPSGRPRTEILPETIVQLRDQGLSFRKIAEKTGLGYGTVRRVYQEYLKDSSNQK